MTYGNFILFFLVIPIGILTGWSIVGHWQQQLLEHRVSRSFWLAIAATSAIALIYTTFWDNYLVATRVWWYHPEMIWGVLLGWVPLEEYLFFVLQPILTGLVLVGWLTRRSVRTDLAKQRAPSTAGQIQKIGVSLLAVCWLLAVVAFRQLDQTRYLSLLLLWAVPPLALQWWVGWYWLLSWWKPLLSVLSLTTLYLAIADTLAISQGIWTINPSFSLGRIGHLPIEELIFFLITNLLIVCSLTLLLRVPLPTKAAPRL